MRGLRWILSGVRRSLRRRHEAEELESERTFHIQARVDDLVAGGRSFIDATRQAHIDFGGRAAYEEGCRDARGFPVLDPLLSDIRYAARGLARSRQLVMVSILSLGIGVGVNTMLFSAVASLFLSAPTGRQPERLVWVATGQGDQLSYPNYRELAASGIFNGVLGYRPVRVSLRSGAGGAEGAGAMAVTGNFFEVLGVAAHTGRVFTSSETRPELEPRVAVATHRLWTRWFGREPFDPAGELTINGQRFSVIGVLPEDYRPLAGLAEPDLYLPLSAAVFARLTDRENANSLTVLGRLADTTSREGAQAAVTAFGRRLERADPVANKDMSRPARLDPFGGFTFAGAPRAAVVFPPMLGGLCLLVLVIACANVAGLLLARLAGRQRELAVRVALGASRRRLLQLLMTESAILAALGTLMSMLLVLWLRGYLRNLVLPVVGPLRLRVELDRWLLACTILFAILTAAGCGLMPAWWAARPDVSGRLKQSAGPGLTGRLWLRQAFVIVQVAASVVLVILAVLFTRTLVRLSTQNTGMDIDRGLVAQIELQPRLQARETQLRLAERTIEKFSGIAGVASSSVADLLPLGLDMSATRFLRAGQAGAGPRTLVNSIGPRYFETLGIPVRRGREFRSDDRSGAPPVVIVTEAFARTYFPGEEPLGQMLTPAGESGAPATVVGTVADANFRYLDEPPTPVLYYAYAQRPVSSQPRPLTLLIRAAGPARAIVRPIVNAVREIDRDQAVRVVTLREATSWELGLRRAGTILLAVLGVLGLLLAIVGLFGVIRYIVASQTTEIGVRMALGASPRLVTWEIVRYGLKLIACGSAAGFVAAIAAARAMAAFVDRLTPADPVTLAVVALTMASVGLVAVYLPARRAARVDPLVALRCE